MQDELIRTVEARLHALRDARAQFQDRLAPDFSVFDFIGPNELKLSRILSWLLDPRGTHGQGAAFLSAFLKWISVPWAEADVAGAKVMLEAPAADGRRIDILITAPTWAIAVENKPWAGDQDAQLRDYLSFLKPYPRRCLVYLAGGRGRLPAEHSLPSHERECHLGRGELHLSSYVDLCDWIDLCRGACRAERVRTFLDDLQQYIHQEFGGAMDMSEQRALLDSMMATPATVEAAASIAAAWPAAQAALLNMLAEQLRRGRPEGWAVDGALNQQRESTITLSPPAADHWFAITFDSSRYADFGFGIQLGKSSKVRASQLNDMIKASGFGLGSGGPDGDWAWWRHTTEQDPDIAAPAHWLLVAAPWNKVRKGELAQEILGTARRLLSVTGAVSSA